MFFFYNNTIKKISEKSQFIHVTIKKQDIQVFLLLRNMRFQINYKTCCINYDKKREEEKENYGDTLKF